MNKKLKKFRSSLKKLNYKHNRKIRIRSNKDNTYTIFLDKWKNGKHHYEFLDLYVELKHGTEKSDDKTLTYIRKYRDKLENLSQVSYNSDNTNYHLADFIKIFESLTNKKVGGNKKKWDSTLVHLKKFAGEKLLIKDINPNFCFSFFNYLIRRTNRSTPKTYYKVFSAALNYLVNENYIPTNPAKSASQRSDFKIKARKLKAKDRVYLTAKELKIFMESDTKYSEVKDAFIVSCFTGLRLGDIRELRFNNISNDHIKLKQKKTSETLEIFIHKSIRYIFKKKHSKTGLKEKVFDLPNTKIVNKRLKYILAELDIDKHITSHCARHTFATLLLAKDVPIYTLSKLLGHKDIASTQIYAKIIDKKKDEAIKKLPDNIDS